MIPDYTTVVGLDRKHLVQIGHTWPTWQRHKPAILQRPMIVFYDYQQVNEDEIREVVKHPQLTTVPWPFPPGAQFKGDNTSKWDNPQRNKMLCGFVYVAAKHVKTRYWLKIDCDVVATGRDDWIDPAWFVDSPAIVAHRWAFTKPPNQMDLLDQWAEQNQNKFPVFGGTEPLNLHPKSPESSRLRHRRIISWCGLFHTNFTRLCAAAATVTCEPLNMPCPSQDGFMFYMAKRLGFPIVTADLKKRGWSHWSTMKNVVKYSQRAMENE